MEEEINKIPKPEIPNTRLMKIETIVMPHPYCITPKHLEYSDSMYLDIEGAEKKGAVCDICKNKNRKDGTKILSFKEHEQIKTLFIEVPHHDLNKIEGLVDYLNSIKPICAELKIAGFAFPTKNQWKG